jgi:hypothetical protein
MSTEAVGELRIDVTVQLAKMQAQFDDMQRRVRTLNNKVNSEFRSMAKGIQSAMGAVGLSLSAGALIAYGKQVIALGGQITDLSNAAGVNSTAFQALALHFMDSGVSMEELSKAFVKLRQATQDAVAGNKQMQATFASLGIDPVKLQTMALERQLEVLAISIVNATDQNKAFNAALDIIGAKGAPKLLAALKELGVEGYDKIANATKKWQLSPEQLKTLDDAGDKLERMWMYVKLIGAKGLVAADSVLSHTTTTPSSRSMGREDLLTPNDFSGGIFKSGFVPPFSATKTPDQVRAAQAKAQQAEAERARLAAEQAAKLKSVRPDYKANPIDSTDMSYEDQEKIRNKISENIKKQDEELKKLGETFQKMADPNKEFNDQLIDIDTALKAGTISADAATLAIQEVHKAMDEAAGPRVDAALSNFFNPLDEKQREIQEHSKKTQALAEDIGGAFASSFEEAILSGKKFSQVLQSLGRDLMAILLRRLITIPIANAITGGIVGMLPAFAEGGEPPTNRPSLVGEEGPEIFVPKTAGTIIPNSALKGGASGRSGNTYVIDARGTDIGVVDRLAKALKALAGPGIVEQRSISAVGNYLRRGGSFA